MPLDQNPHQTRTRFKCVGFSMYACGFSVSQMRQFCQIAAQRWPNDISSVGENSRTIAQWCQQAKKTLKQWRKWFWISSQITVREVGVYVAISFGSCQAIFTDVLGMKRAAAKIVKKLLNFKQKKRCRDLAQQMLTKFNEDPELLKNVINDDESTQPTVPMSLDI